MTGPIFTGGQEDEGEQEKAPYWIDCPMMQQRFINESMPSPALLLHSSSPVKIGLIHV